MTNFRPPDASGSFAHGQLRENSKREKIIGKIFSSRVILPQFLKINSLLIDGFSAEF